MIVKSIDTLAEKLAYEDRLKTNQAEVKSIETTLNILHTVAKKAQLLVSQLEICAPYIGQQEQNALRVQANRISIALNDSLQRFATNRKEQLPLQRSNTDLQRALDTLDEHWKDYANKRIAPYIELLRLVEYLPEVASSSAEINKIVRQLQDKALKPPDTQALINQFHLQLEELGQLLDTVAKLPPSVKIFLERIIDNQATLADLTPEVRLWIEQGGREAAFSISFKQRRS